MADFFKNRFKLERRLLVRCRRFVQRALPRIPPVAEHDVKRRRRSDDDDGVVVGVVQPVVGRSSASRVVDDVVWKRLDSLLIICQFLPEVS
jgi:hypothetical protein